MTFSKEAMEAYRQRVAECAEAGFRTKGATGFAGKDILILAMGPSRGLCPFDAETWSVNQGYKQIGEMRGRVDKIFLAHEQVYSEEHNPYFDWEEMNQLADRGVEILNTHDVKELKHTPYPVGAVIERFGVDYFSDTICYMLAYALYLYTEKRDGRVVLTEPLRIRLYGVDIQDKDEYIFEKPGVEFWLGYAMALGAEVTISFGSTLLKTVNGLRYGEDLPTTEYDPFGLLGSTDGA